MLWTQTTRFRTICRIVLCLFVFQSLHPATWRVPWKLDISFDTWPLNFGPTLAYGQSSDPNLAATPDANKDDPFIIQKAQELGNDPVQIFNFVRDEIGYESYKGSLRGARGTLWSKAGNALDQASLLIALLRASNIPARYVQGTLSNALAQQLILSMFPEPLRVLGCLDPDVERADPANHLQLLEETREHYWVQFGSGFQDADPMFTNAIVGQTFTSSEGTFSEVPDSLRHKVTVRLKRELTLPGAGLLTGGNASQDVETALEERFNTVELVGRSLSIGHLVNTTDLSTLFTAVTHNYTPFILVNQRDGNVLDDPLGTGADYQEILTSFPFGNQILTGLFLEVEIVYPEVGGTRRTDIVNKTLLDRIGFVARQHGGSGITVSVDATAGPAWTNRDVVTLEIAAWRLVETPVSVQLNALDQIAAELQALVPLAEGLPSTSPVVQDALKLSEQFALEVTSALAGRQIIESGELADFSASTLLSRLYRDTPEIVAVSKRVQSDPATQETSANLAIDILRNAIRSLAAPGQAKSAVLTARSMKSLGEKSVEQDLLVPTAGGDPSGSLGFLLKAFAQPDVQLAIITSENLADLGGYDFPAEASARISRAVLHGKVVLVPSATIMIENVARLAWLEMDVVTGDFTAVLDDGTHGVEEPKELPLLPQLRALYHKFDRPQDLGKLIQDLKNATTREEKQRALDALELLFNSPVLESALKLITQARVFVDIGGPVNSAGNAVTAAKSGLAALRDLEKFSAAKHPPVGHQLYSPATLSQEFDALGNGVGSGVAVAIFQDPLFAVRTAGAEVPTVFKMGFKNLTSAPDRFTIDVSSIPPGFEIRQSVPSILLPPGESGEISVCLHPIANIPAEGTLLSFDVTATSTNNPGISTTVTESFTVPAISAVTSSLDPPVLSTTPGAPIETVLTLKSVGNSPANVTFDVDAPTDVTISGLTQLTLNPGETVTQTLTLAPSAGVPLNNIRSVIISPQFGQPQPEVFRIVLRIAVPGADAIASASVAAEQLGNAALANRLNDLSIALTNLVQNPSSDVFKSQALGALDSILSQLANDPNFSSFVNDLTAARNALAAANTASAIQTAVNSLGNTLDAFATGASGLAQHNFEAFLLPNSQVAQPQTPAVFALRLHNIGTDTTTYNVSLGTLPTGVTGQLNRASVTLDRNEFASINVTLTQTATTELLAFNFAVTVAAADAPSVSRTVQGALTVRNDFISVVEVSADPPFTDPGGQVNVSARLLNVVNQQRQALVSYIVKGPNGQTVFTSQPVQTTLTVQTSLVMLVLGAFDTTGFNLGQHSIAVTVTDLNSTPIPGATGEGNLLIGSPVTASIAIAPTTLPPGNGMVLNTLQINSQGGAGGQLAVVGQVPSTAFVGNAVLNDLALNGNFAYVFANNGLHVVDIANPTAPAWLRNVGGGEHSSGEVAGNRLIAIAEGPSSSVAQVSARGLIDFFTLASPGTPAQPFRQQANTFTYQAASDLIVVGNNAFVATNLVCFNTTTNDVFSQHGDVLSISIDPSRQITSNIFQLEDVLLNTNGSTQGAGKTTGCWENGGNFNLVDIVQVSADTLLAASSTATGTNTQTGFGRIRVVDISNPASLAVIDTAELPIPGTVQVHGIAINGNVAFVTATQGGWRDPFTDVNDIGPTGNIVLATVDVTTPRHPQLIHTQVLNRAARGMGEPLFVGNGRFAFASLGALTDSPQIIVVDASNPNDLVIVTQFDVAAPIRGMRTAGNFLYTSGPDGLTIYQLGGVGNIPVTAQVQIPNNTGVAVVPNSFSIPPTSSITGTDFDTLVWEFTGSQTVTWQSNITNLQPGEAREVTLETTVDFTFQGTPGQITLPPTFVTSQHILAMAPPPTRTARPGEAASYTLTVKNPTAAAVTYALSVQGIPLAWVDFAPSITVPANSETNVALTLTSDPFAALAEYGFVVTASTNTGTTGSVQGSLLLQGAPVLPSADPVARGVVVSLTPAQATAGQGTPAHFVLRLTNTGSATDTFALTAGVPTGVTATLEVTSVEVPPGASNFRDVSLTLTPQPGSATGNRPFTVTATSATQATVHDTANGTVTVVGNGVDVALTPTSGPPSSTYQLRVTNTGQGQDTFDLAAGGPGALVATLGTNAVTLASGASQNVPITVGAINFAYTGNLALVGIATSRGNQAVQDSAAATVTIAATQSITARFDPASVTLPIPGAAAFLLLVDNTGNTEDAYTATITGTTGPITASLNGLDGQPTQTIPLFRLPGLSRGALVLDTTLTAVGQGMVTVRITSQTNAAITASATATVQTPGGGNRAPVANAGPDQTLPLGETVLLDGSTSTDPDHGPAALRFQWSVAARPPGSALTNAQISDATTARAAFTPDVIGDYTLRLTVSDGALSAADEVLIHVQNTPPVAEAGPDRTAKTGMEVTLNGSDSFDPNGDLITYDWTLIDQPAGSALTSQSLTGRQTPKPTFTPDRRGRYVFELIVNDGLVDSEPDTVAITASPSNVPPNADAGPDQYARVGTAVVLDGSASHDPDQSPRPLTYQWTFKPPVPAGSTLRNAHIQTAMQAQASFVPDMAGTYVLNLRVSDGSASGNDEVVITASASNVPPNADASEDQTVTPGTEVALEGLGSHDPDAGPAALSYTWRFVSLPHGSIRTNADIVDADLATARFTPDVVGSYVVRLEVFDGEASAFDNVLITATPCIERVTASPNVLWPPNHKMVPVTVGVSVSNRCRAAPVCQISSVRSNEPVNGLGDGDTAPDWEITGALTVRLRAERSGQGSGREYTITVSCTEGAGHNATGTTTVQVPHDQGKK